MDKLVSLEEFKAMHARDRATDPISSGVHLQSSGKLETEVADAFISTVMDTHSEVMGEVTVERMTTESKRIDLISLAKRAMRKAVEGTAPTGVQVYTPSSRTLLVEEVITAHDVTKSWLEDNVMREGGLEFINAEFAKQFRNDMVDLGFNGDGTTSGFLACNKGWLQLIKEASTTNKVDVPAANVDYDAIFGLLYAALPNPYKPRTSEFKFWVSTVAWQGYKDQLKARNTSLGDAIITGNQPVYWMGIEVVPREDFPVSNYLLCRPKNLVAGIHERDISIDIDWAARKRMYEVTISARIDFEFAVADELVLGYDITP